MQLRTSLQGIKIVAATGHRPGTLSSGNGGNSSLLLRPLRQRTVSNNHLLLRRLVDLALWYFKDKKPDKVISGMALGWDMAVAIASIKLDIPLIAAIPFEDYDRLWKPQDKLLCSRLLVNCEDVVIVCDGDYSAQKMMIRNKYLVDNCTNLVALYNGISAGGTSNCIKYAVSKNVPIDNLWDVFNTAYFGY